MLTIILVIIFLACAAADAVSAGLEMMETKSTLTMCYRKILGGSDYEAFGNLDTGINLGGDNIFKLDNFTIAGEEPTTEEYEELQRRMRAEVLPRIDALLPALFNEIAGLSTTFEDFRSRVTMGVEHILVDRARGIYPAKGVTTLGDRPEDCVVTSSKIQSMGADRAHEVLLDLEYGLRRGGFRGKYIYRLGGFPMARGTELQLAAVPYAVKMFMIAEARLKHGCRNVLWVDSRMYPLRDITPIFDHIRAHGIFFFAQRHGATPGYLFPATRRLLHVLTGLDPVDVKLYTAGPAVGFNFDDPLAQEFFDQIYQLMDQGNSHVSCMPDEHVWTALANGPRYRHMVEASLDLAWRLLVGPGTGSGRAVPDGHYGDTFFLHRVKDT